MQPRLLEINVISATELKNVRRIMKSRIAVYAVVSITGESQPEQRTDFDRDGGINPKWNQHMRFTFDKSAAKQNSLILMFQLWCKRTAPDKYIGAVCVPVKELLGKIGAYTEVCRDVTTPSGIFRGKLNFSYKIGKISDKANPTPPPPPPPPPPSGESSFERVGEVAAKALVQAGVSLAVGAAAVALAI